MFPLIWYLDDDRTQDIREARQLNPGHFLSQEQFTQETLIKYLFFMPGSIDGAKALERVRSHPRYCYEDEMIHNPDRCTHYPLGQTPFFHMHSHNEIEIWFILEGSVYMDVGSDYKRERIVRIALRSGDFLVIPSKTGHRFALDHHNHVHAIRCLVWGSPFPLELDSVDDVDLNAIPPCVQRHKQEIREKSERFPRTQCTFMDEPQDTPRAYFPVFVPMTRPRPLPHFATDTNPGPSK